MKHAAVLALFVLSTAQAAPARHVRFKPGGTSPKVRQNAPPAEARNGFAPVAGPNSVATVSEIASDFAYNEIASHGEGVIKSDVVKFLIDNRGQTPTVHFINGNFQAPNVPEYVKYHYNFAQTILKVRLGIEEFNQSTYFTNDLTKKKFIAGTLQHYKTTNDDFYGVQFYPQDAIAEQSILLAVSAVRKAVTIPNSQMRFVSYGLQQTVKTVAGELSKQSIAVTSLDEIYKSIPYIAMNKGEAWGYLRTTAVNATPTDIVLLNELPLDLSVVAGVITTVIQDAGSHVNLKSKERGTPDMVLRDPKRVQSLLQNFENRPIHLVVKGDDFTVTPSTETEVKEHARKTNLKPWLNFQLSPLKTLATFDEMANVSRAVDTIPLGLSYGGKASKLGFLAHKDIVGIGSAIQKKLGHRLTPLGFGLPIAHYFDFVKANPPLAKKINAFIALETSAKPPEGVEKQKALDEIQTAFYSATVPAPLVQLVSTKIEQFKADVKKFYPRSELKKLKIRSSANSEDVEDFDGAGLHDSFSASLKNGLGDPAGTCRVEEKNDGVATKSEMDPENVMCGIKGVYASLWNRRAVEERSYARINHASAGMGLAFNQTYGFREKTEGITEIANAVIVTRILAGSGLYGYQISLNTADNLVTNPTTGTQSEVVLAMFMANETPAYTIAQFAKPSPTEPARTESIVTPQIYQRLVDLARAVEVGYCQAVPGYYSDDCSYVAEDPEKPKSLDMEFKIFSNGEVLVKQSCEFGGK